MFPRVIDQLVPSAKCTDDGLDLLVPTAPQKRMGVMQRTSFSVHQIVMAASSPSGPTFYTNRIFYDSLLKTQQLIIF